MTYQKLAKIISVPALAIPPEILATSTPTVDVTNGTLKFAAVTHIEINIIKNSSLAITKITLEETNDSPT